ncbi:hypothetical protein I5N09_11900 [Serratia marcescens]|nr:hypothetical protein [Serratia marcescens]MBH3218716.1 hypothetical protein [Serratia marcescens]
MERLPHRNAGGAAVIWWLNFAFLFAIAAGIVGFAPGALSAVALLTMQAITRIAAITTNSQTR